jgi:uncharacterized protein
MKPSHYNNYIPLENGEYILYNTLSRAILIVDEEAKKGIQECTNEEEELPLEAVDYFRQCRVLVDDNENEVLMVRQRYSAKCYSERSLTFIVSPTALCNLSCCYCWQRAEGAMAQQSTLKTTMSQSTVKGVLQFIKSTSEELNARQVPIMFFGGEPLVARDLLVNIYQDLAAWCTEHAAGMSPKFSTNCTLFDEALIQELQTYCPIEFVRVPLDGPPEIHDQYRFFSQVEIQYNINPHYRYAPQLFDDLIERGLRDVTVNCHRLFDPSSFVLEVKKVLGLLEDTVCVPKSRILPPFGEVSRAKKFVYSWALKKGFKLHPPKFGLFLPCQGASYYMYVIDPRGEVYKCPTAMLTDSMEVGHIHENGTLEKYPFWYEWMDADPVNLSACQSCSFLPSCGGGCIYARKLVEQPYLCNISSLCGEDYIKMYLKQKYPDRLKFINIDDTTGDVYEF